MERHAALPSFSHAFRRGRPLREDAAPHGAPPRRFLDIGVRAFRPTLRALPGPPAQASRLNAGGGTAPPQRRTVSELLAGGPCAPGRSPRPAGSRVTSPARGRRIPSCRRCVSRRHPSGDGTGRNIVWDGGWVNSPRWIFLVPSIAHSVWVPACAGTTAKIRRMKIALCRGHYRSVTRRLIRVILKNLAKHDVSKDGRPLPSGRASYRLNAGYKPLRLPDSEFSSVCPATRPTRQANRCISNSAGNRY